MDPLRRCTGDTEVFLDGTWGARAAVHPGVEPEGFQDLLTLDDVDRILTTTSLRTPSFRSGEGGRADPGVELHPSRPNGIQTRVGDGRPGEDRGAVRRRRDHRAPGAASQLGTDRGVHPRARTAARTHVPGQRLYHSPGLTRACAARRSARRLRAASLRPQALGGPMRLPSSGRAIRSTRTSVRRLHLHADGNPARRDDGRRVVRSPHGRRARRQVERRPRRHLAFLYGRSHIRGSDPGRMDNRPGPVRRPVAPTARRTRHRR